MQVSPAVALVVAAVLGIVILVALFAFGQYLFPLLIFGSGVAVLLFVPPKAGPLFGGGLIVFGIIDFLFTQQHTLVTCLVHGAGGC